MLSRRVHALLAVVASLQAALLFGLAFARYTTVHNRTFDLALYTRVAWGLARGDFWSPITDCHAFGVHVSPVLLPLGWLGRALGEHLAPLLLLVQALAVALCVWPIARVAARRMGTQGIMLGVSAWLLYPNLGHVATYEFHPGTLAVLPLCWAYDALDRNDLSGLAWACAGVLACREDLGIACVLLALLLFAAKRDRRALALALGALSYTALALSSVVAHAPSHAGSLDLHFGVWGGSPLGVVRALFEDPARVWDHFSDRSRLLYLPRLLAPLSFFALRAPSLLVPALPYLGLNLLSEFPTADEQYSHYLTPAVPALVIAGVVGASVVRARFVRGLWFATLGIAHVAMGGLPLSRDFERAAFASDDSTRAARAVLAQIPASMSVQAPDALLPHLAARKVVHRAPPPDRDTDYVVLDLSHRLRFAHEETLLRTSEEPGVRTWLARESHGVTVYQPPYALLEKGMNPRAAAGVRAYFVDARRYTASGRRLSACLSLLEALELGADRVELVLRAHDRCPSDLALRIGPEPEPRRVDLLFDGALSPAHLRAGDVVRSVHSLARRQTRLLYVGLLRSSGARPAPEDPIAVRALP